CERELRARPGIDGTRLDMLRAREAESPALLRDPVPARDRDAREDAAAARHDAEIHDLTGNRMAAAVCDEHDERIGELRPGWPALAVAGADGFGQGPGGSASTTGFAPRLQR